jgi:cell division septation protein DedD
MISNGPGSIPPETPAQPGAAAQVPLPAAAPKKNIQLIWISFTLCAGLLTATGYVGSRILTAKSNAATPPPVTRAAPRVSVAAQATEQATPPQVREQATPPQVVAPATATPAAATVDADDWPLIEPQPGERYIQLAAVNPESARRYSGDLRRYNLAPRLAPGPAPGVLRVVIGPFPDDTSLHTAKAQLEVSGIEHFIRTY